MLNYVIIPAWSLTSAAVSQRVLYKRPVCAWLVSRQWTCRPCWSNIYGWQQSWWNLYLHCLKWSDCYQSSKHCSLEREVCLCDTCSCFFSPQFSWLPRTLFAGNGVREMYTSVLISTLDGRVVVLGTISLYFECQGRSLHKRSETKLRSVITSLSKLEISLDVVTSSS